MIKVKDGYAKLIGTTYQGSATQVLLSNGGDLEYSASSKASTLVQRNASQYIYATYFNSAISDEALTDIGSVYVRNTSDTFIRRVSKTQFYSILDDKFVTLDTTQSITGAKTFSTSVRFANNASIIQNQKDTSNYTTILKWYKNGASRNTYDPSIGQHNTGGDGKGSICILPYPTETSPWGGTVGLFISKGVLKLDGKSVALAENYYTKTESDGRYVNVTGDTMTGPLIVKAAITGTQLISTIATGTSPLKVTSTTVVTNLNSDLLDGVHETSLFRARGSWSIASSVPTTTELATSNNLCGSWNVRYTGASGHLVQFNAERGSTRYMQFYSMYSGSLYWRNSTDSTLNTKSWKTILDSSNYTAYINPANFVTALGTSGNYLTWTKAGTTNNITVPYATNSNQANYIYYGSISNLNSPSSWTSDGYRLVYDTYSDLASNKPVSWDHANGIITLFKSKHGTSNQYVSQLAFPNNTRMYFRCASAGSFSSWYTIAYTSDIKDPANYYWANVKVSASSNSGTSPTFSTAYTSNWFRSTGSTGWYSQTYGGGIYMTDSTYVRVYNSKIFYASAGYLAPYTGSSWISMATRSNCIVADQNNSTSSAHCLFRAKYNNGNALCFGGLGNDLGFYGFSATNISNGTNSYAWIAKWDSGGSFFNTGSITAAGGFYHNSVNSNNYVLLAGGSYKSLADFAKGNAGASNRGVYVTNGTVTAMTYYLNATINSGASGKLAYYSGTNSIDDYTSTVGSSGTPIYLSGGVPTACTGVMVKYWASYTINNYSGTSVTYSKNGGNYNFVTSTSRRDTGRYTIGTVYPSGQTWYTTLVWAVGNLNASNPTNSSNSLLYCTLIRGYNSGSTYYWYVNTADDASTNNGSFGLFFLCF